VFLVFFMDISRAVDEFVSSGILLFHHLQAEGQSLSRLELHTLAAQLQVLQSDQQSRSPRAPARAPILRMFDPHSMDLYWDKALLLETVIAFIRVGLEMQDTVVGPCNENVPGSYCRRVTARGFEKEDLLFL
jgi:hypothetical protein